MTREETREKPSQVSGRHFMSTHSFAAKESAAQIFPDFSQKRGKVMVGWKWTRVSEGSDERSEKASFSLYYPSTFPFIFNNNNRQYNRSDLE